MKQKTYKLHTDPGHGWLAVRRRELEDLAIADKITRYSYQKGDTVYLEEDCDLETFAKAFRAKHGVELSIVESFREKTFVRNCEPYSVERTVVVKVPTQFMTKLVGAKIEVSEEMTAAEARKVRDAWNRKHAHLSYDGE